MNDVVIKIESLSKSYKLYEKPIDRLKEALSIKHKKYYTEHYAVKDINLEIKKGEIVGLVGTNGSGKSTLLKMITGVLNPTDGNIIVNGSISALLELGTGFNPEFTGIENIYLYGTMVNKSRKQIDEEVEEIIHFADIGEFIYQPVKTYSSGMFARLAFSVAINIKPDILIVDEILAVGDTKFQLKCMNKMKKMMNGGTTILFVSHDSNTIKKICNKAIWIDKGNMIAFGNVDRVVDDYLDFLKLGKIEYDNVKWTSEKAKALPEFDRKENVIAEIQSFKIYSEDKEIDEFPHNAPIKIEVVYDVYNEDIKHPVLGVAIRTIDNIYVCGLNTRLDGEIIPWQVGRNVVELLYPYGVLGIGGRYYFDVALFEETVTVSIQYLARIKDFTVNSKYCGEGQYIIPHRWL